jgi:hypothetical protein
LYGQRLVKLECLTSMFGKYPTTKWTWRISLESTWKWKIFSSIHVHYSYFTWYANR